MFRRRPTATNISPPATPSKKRSAYFRITSPFRDFRHQKTFSSSVNRRKYITFLCLILSFSVMLYLVASKVEHKNHDMNEINNTQQDNNVQKDTKDENESISRGVINEDELDPDHLPRDLTGAFANCTEYSTNIAQDHPEQKSVTISCRTISYRMKPLQSLEKIVIGVLSAASGDGPERRKSIRETWAMDHSVFFLVAGAWDAIREEYDNYKDMIWLNDEEIYDGEKSVLTEKTLAFVQIIHDVSMTNKFDVKYVFKTDDDSFLNVEYLHKYLLTMQHDEEYNYWGWCRRIFFKPLRGDDYKWSVSYKTYPEKYFPRYCQGAGFALSWKFLSCAAGHGQHIANMRFMPFEDVATGLVARRCNIVPTMTDDKRLLHMYRTDSSEERNRVNQGRPKIDKSKLPIPDMEGRIVQHRIHDAWDMREHFKQMKDPEMYKKSTNIKWYNRDDE